MHGNHSMVRRTIVAMLSKTCCSPFRFPRRFWRPPSRRTSFTMGARGNCKASMMLGEERFFFAVSLNRTIYRRPLGFLSNMDAFRSQLYDGWPSFPFAEQSLVNDGPLPKRCPCHSAHKTLKKSLTHENDFISSSFPSGHRYCRRLQSSSFATPSGMAGPMQV